MSLLNKLTKGSDLSALNGGTPTTRNLDVTKLQAISALDRETYSKYVDNKPQ